jgi:predicted transcriptional regulator
MKMLSLKLPDALAARLHAAARKRQASKSVLVREALEAYLTDGGQPKGRTLLDAGLFAVSQAINGQI